MEESSIPNFRCPRKVIKLRIQKTITGVGMIKVLVVYDSRTGHTEKMAFAVAEGAKQISGAEVVLKKVDQTSLEDLLNANGITLL